MGRRKITHEEFVEKLKHKNPDIDVIGVYTKSSETIDCKCNKCGYEWKPIAGGIMHGSGCPSCANLKRKTPEEFATQLAKIKPNIVLLDEFKNTRTKMRAKCVVCNHEWFTNANTLINTPHGCPNCAGVSKVTIDDFIKALMEHDLELLDDVDDKNFNSKLNMSVKCRECNYEFTTNYNRVKSQKSGCPVCKNKKVLKGHNDIWTTNPEIASLLLNKEDGFKYTYASNKKVNWKCPTCENIINKSVSEVYYNGLSCQNCTDGLSYPEKFIKNLLHSCNINYIYQKRFDWSDNKKYDFYLPDKNLIIETHGMQHYKENNHFANRTLLEEQENDKYKNHLALSNGIKYYIVLDCRYSKCDWIKNSIVNSSLFQICNIDCENVNWEHIDIESRGSLVYKVCELYSKGAPKSDILNKLGISETTYCKYLNIGAKNNLCDYDSLEIKRECGRKSGIASRKPILCITTNKKFDSIKNASKYYGFSSTYLSHCLKDGKKYCGIDKNTNQKLEWKLL